MKSKKHVLILWLLLLAVSICISGCRKTARDRDEGSGAEGAAETAATGGESAEPDGTQSARLSAAASREEQETLSSAFAEEDGTAEGETALDASRPEEKAAELTEEELQEAVYQKYYEPWSEDEMMEALRERNGYYQASRYHSEIQDYVENVREIRDIANVTEPLFYTDMKYYSEEDFRDVPPLVIHIAKNEIYARHGYIFKNEDLNEYFMGCIWYVPTCESGDFDDSVWNEYERENVKLLSELDHA